PPAPFISDKKGEASNEWIRLALKRMMRYGAENGFDKISWTTAKQQIDRWETNLRKNVDKIHWQRINFDSQDESSDVVKINTFKEGENTGSMTVPLEGETKIEGKKVTLDRLLGKSMANKIRASKDRTGTFEGDNSIGGGVHKYIYDNAMPSIARKLGRAFRAKVSQTELIVDKLPMPTKIVKEIKQLSNRNTELGSELERIKKDIKISLEERVEKAYPLSEELINNDDKIKELRNKYTKVFGGYTQPSIDITDKMRESVMLGQPLFQRTNFTPDTEKVQQHSTIAKMKSHTDYDRAKNHEDSLAGKRLVRDLIKKDKINSLKDALGEEVIVVGVLAEEKHGLNTIPSEMEEYVSELTGWEINEDIIQSNKVEHTGTKHIDRLFSQAEFEGNVKAGKQYVIMDDVIGSGSTLLNLKGYIENNGGIVKQVIVLGAGMFKSKMQPRAETIKTLEEKFSGNELQSVLDSIYGKGTQKEQISESEARTIRDNAGYTLNRIRKSESTSKDSEGQKAVERVQQSQSDKTSLNTPKFQKADQNRPDFINQMAEIYNELGRPNKPEFIQALKDGGWSKKHIKKASMLYTQLKEKGIVEEGVVTPLEKEITKLEEAETTAIKDIEDAKWRSDEQKEARKTRDAIHQRIKDLIAGHRIGGKEKKLELRKLKMMIRNYAKTHLPKYEITRGQIKPVLTALTNVKNERQLLAVFSRIDQIADKVYKKQLNRKILKTLKSVKMKKVSGKLIGKLTADDQDVVEQIRKIVKMTSAEAEEEKELIVSLAIKENTEPEGKQGVRWNLLELFGGLNTKSVDQLSDALLNLQSIIETGKTLRSIEEQVRKEKNKLMIKKTVKVTTGGKEVHGKMLRRTEGRDDSSMYNKVWNGLRGMNSKLQSWETLLDILSFNDKDSAPYQSFLNKKFGKDLREADLSEQEGVRLKEAILTENAERIFGAKGKALEKILNQNEEIVAMDIQVLKEIVPERFHKYKDLPKSSIKLSQNELAQYWMWMQDPKLTETFKLMGFTKETTRQIEKVLDPKVKEYAEFLLDEFYPAYYPEINTVYRQMFYVNLSNNPKYSHLSREHYGKDTDMAETLDSTSPLASAYSGHLIARVDSTKPLQPTDMLRNVYQHIFQMEHFISHAQAIRQIRAVFNSPEVRSAIEEMYGVQILQTFDRFVEDIARGGIDSKLIWKTADTAIRHFVKAKIGLKPVIFLKQLASTPANMAEIPVHAFVGGMGSFFINPKKVFNTLYDSETVQGSRLVKSRGKGYSRDVRSLLMKSTTKRLSASKGFRDYIMALAKTGDISAILMGGWSVYQYHYKQQTEAGKTEKEAHVFAIEKFDASAEKWQQSGQIKNLSEFQRGGSVMKLYTMFLNSPIQYFQQGEAGLRNLVAGRGSKTENIKRTFIAWGLMPYIFYSIGMGMFAMTPGDDDKFWKRMATAWTKGIPIVGNFIEWWALRRAWHFSLTPLTSGVEDLGRAGKAIGDLIEAELQDEELTQKQVIKMADDILDAMGTVVGFPYEGISGVAEGIAETVTGKADKPIQRSLGYSNYSLYGTNHPKSLILIKAIEHNKGEGAYLSDLRSYYKGNGKTDRYIDMQRKKDKKIYQIRKKYGFKDSRINDLLKADNEKKIKLLSRMQKTMTKQEYQNQKRALVRYKVISEDVSNMRR
ncbi:MAG: phosphoribosyltransferase, partial [Candidatus Marinimicrobia bacterium]|nr:phosphoribosyltransferase [Candidatus Neomarinimicrobiota bacterium]